MRKIALVALLSLCLAATAVADCETSTLTFLTETLPSFSSGQPVNFQIEAIGGEAPYHFEIIEGELPAGLHFSASGRIVGVPTEPADVTVLVLLTDASGCTIGQAFPVRVDQF